MGTSEFTNEVQQLLEFGGSALTGTTRESLWVDEAERRYQAYLEGSVTARPATMVFQEARERLR